MALTDDDNSFLLDGVVHVHADLVPDFSEEPAKRFTYGQEPHVIAQVPLLDGGTVQVHGYAAHWTAHHVSVEWVDDDGKSCGCWVLASQVRRPVDDEWRGRYRPR